MCLSKKSDFLILISVKLSRMKQAKHFYLLRSFQDAQCSRSG